MACPDLLEYSLSKNTVGKYELIGKWFNSQKGMHLFQYSVPFQKSLFSEILRSFHLLLKLQDEPLWEQLQVLGKRIHQFFFFDSNGQIVRGLEDFFNREESLVVFLHGEIESLPFELAFDGDLFLSAARSISRNIPKDSALTLFNKAKDQKNRRKSSWRSKKSMMIVVDPARNSSSSYEEGLALYQYCLKENNLAPKKVDFLSKSISKMEWLEILENYDIVHYAGHGGWAEQGGAILIGENILFWVEDLKALVNPPEFLFFNACQVGDLEYVQSNSSSLLKRMLLLGVGNILVSNSFVMEEDFRFFICSFYKSLFLENSLGETLLYMKKRNLLKKDKKLLYFILYGFPEYSFDLW